MTREQQTLEAMIRLYCRKHHGQQDDLCDACQELYDYSRKRLAHCPFQEGKTACGQCQVHCYKLAMRERICEVMRDVGPTMIRHHPLMALAHVLDGFRKEPVKSQKGEK
jgi:hypothetical protein